MAYVGVPFGKPTPVPAQLAAIRSQGTRANCRLRLAGSSVARAVATTRVESKFASNEIASASRHWLRRLAWCARRPDANAIAVARLFWTPKKHQSGEINYTGRISKIGAPTTIIPFSSRLWSWGQEFGQRADDAVGLDRRSRR